MIRLGATGRFAAAGRWPLAAVLCGSLALLACGGGKNNTAAGAKAPAKAPAATQAAAATPDLAGPACPPGGSLRPVIASSELVTGPNRFTIGILDRQCTPIPDAKVHLKFFELVGQAQGNQAQGTLRFEADATFRSPGREAGLPAVETVTRPDGTRISVASGGDDVGIYEAQVAFDKAGNWGVEADVTGADAVHSGVVRTPFTVLAQSTTPAIGSPAPRSQNLTVKDDPQFKLIDTSAHPSADMHTETVAEAIAQHHPTLVLFATPGYCTSRLCGPELELARKLEPKYQGKADFIHIEIYKNPQTKELMPAVEEWRLQTEPWFFVVDKNGNVAAKFEGPTTLEEIDAALTKVTAG
ncbi:MAG TPA: thioredoxin family protein [Dehalococcoidia bacterium]|nr:thioredoxin family protein [Dehalococcoidia bacterium]